MNGRDAGVREGAAAGGVPIGTILNVRTTAEQNCGAIPRRVRI